MFTQPCFIRKNAPELRRKLDGLGIEIHYTQEKYKEDNTSSIFCNRGVYSIYGRHGYTEELENSIDCGENEELFLALAALRDDSDIFQYITNGNIVITCELDSMNEFLKIFYDGFIKNDEDLINHINNWHKLTVEELIKHFK